MLWKNFKRVLPYFLLLMGFCLLRNWQVFLMADSKLEKHFFQSWGGQTMVSVDYISHLNAMIYLFHSHILLSSSMLFSLPSVAPKIKGTVIKGKCSCSCDKPNWYIKPVMRISFSKICLWVMASDVTGEFITTCFICSYDFIWNPNDFWDLLK